MAQAARENVDSNQLRFEIAAHIHFMKEVKEVLVTSVFKAMFLSLLFSVDTNIRQKWPPNNKPMPHVIACCHYPFGRNALKF